MRSCIYTLLLISALLSLCIAIRIGQKGAKGDRYGQCIRDQRGAEYGSDVIYQSTDNEGCCDPGFRNRDNRCVGCPRGLHYTKCKHQCTLYCDLNQNKPFLNCSKLSGSFFDECEPGCVCPPDQYETVAGECVFFEEVCEGVYRPPELAFTTVPTDAPTSNASHCTDPLMTYDTCHSSCPTTCRNFLEVGACAAVCFSGCRCKEGYIYDESTLQCTLPANCTALPALPQNTAWGCCEGNCLQPFLTKCNSCQFGPQCKPGFVRDRYRNCVDLQYCQTNCSENEIYDDCPFESTCLADNTGQEATTCVPGCRCKDYYVRDQVSGACVLQSDCPTKCTGAYEVPGCSACARTCNTLTSSVDCSSCVRRDTCVCDVGYVRDENGGCVRDRTCVQCDASRNLVQTCSGCISTCDNKDDILNCTQSTNCALTCGCESGFVLNTATRECVTPSSCPVCTDCVSSGNARTYKQEQCLPLLCNANDKVTYTIRFVGSWHRSSHPDFGFTFSHWSPLTGASHKPSYEIWENCFKNVTTGVRNVAERGDPRLLLQEYDTHPEDVLDTIRDGTLLAGNGEITRSLDVNKHFHYITLLSMMGDTKDYMVGVDRLDMCDDTREGWKNSIKVCLKLYSTGTKTDLAPGCPAHSRQFANCSFGYIELTKNPNDNTNAVCTGDNVVYHRCNGFCDSRCEHGSTPPPCPRICQSGCICASGYARNDKDECVLTSQCPNFDDQANHSCVLSDWMDSGFAFYPNDTVQRFQMRFVTQRPTSSSYTCPDEHTRFLNDDDDYYYYYSSEDIGCAVWADTCHMERKCGTTDEYDRFKLRFNDDIYNDGFFEPKRTHGSRTVSFSSLELLNLQERSCMRIGTLGQHSCKWGAPILLL